MKKILKRTISLQIIIAMLCTFIPIIASAATINIGDYIQMGTYYGQPILWRCVDIDANGPLMLSDKILCIKAFDAGTSANSTTGSHSRSSYRNDYGSNYWGDSNMRSWLNSTASAGNVNWLCGNPPIAERLWNGYNAYDQEAGFLSNFTESERNAIKEVTQKSILSYPEIDAGMAATGMDIYNVVQNYDTAYAEYVTDKLFLLDVKQVNAVYNYRSILGDNYYIGKPTAECVAHSEYKFSGLPEGKKWCYWLRSPASSTDCTVRYVYSDGNVSHDFASHHDIGVRPAFYLNLSSFSINSGAGTKSNPYVGYGSGGGGNSGNTNSGSTSEGAPSINSAKLTHSGNTYDIFSQAVTIEKDSDITASIEATVDGNGNNNVKVYITQGIGNEVDITGICKDFQPGRDFSAGKDIYILAIDEDTGKSTSKKTKLKISSLASGKLGGQSGVEGLNFKIGQDTGFTIPDSVPVFGGTEIKWSFDFIPISVEYDKEDNNKINVVFGTNITKKEGDDGREYFSDFNFKEYKKGVKKAARKQNRTLKQLRNDFKMTKDVKMNMFGGNLLAGGSGKGGNSVDVAGYAEMHVTENGLQFAEGQLCVNVEFTYNYQGQVFIWVVPLYYEFGGGAGVGLEGDMINVNPISFSPEFEAYITGKVKGSIGGGVGIAKVATAGAAGEAALNLKKSLKNSYFKADVDGSANFNVKVLGKTVAKKEFASGNFLIYETGNSKGLINGGGISLSSVEDKGMGYFGFDVDIDSVYPNESRIYAENSTEWFGDKLQINLMSVDYTNKNLSKLADNIYTECAPQMCEIDGKKIMVMQWDNSKRADVDRTMLVYSVYDDENGTWSAPVAVDDDGTADFYPCFRNGYLVWQNEKSTLTDDMTLKEIAELGEIFISKWNGGGFDKAVAVTDNNSLDTQPSVTTDGDTVHIVWTTNSEDDIMGQSGTNSIMQSDYNGITLTAPTAVKSGLNAITNISTGIADDKFCIAYVTDDDNDFDTIEDRDIRIIADGGETQLTDNYVLDSNPVFANNMIYYYSGGNIAYSDLYGTDVKTVFDELKAGLTDSFVVDGNYKGDTAVWWTKTLDGCTEVYSSLYKYGEWSDEIQVTSVGNIAKYPSGILNHNGTMLVAFNNGIAENNEIVKTDLYTISVKPSYDIALSDVYFDEDTMTAYATVTNKGELAIEGYKAIISGNSEKVISEPLKAGKSAEIEIEYQKPSDFSKRDIELSVSLGSIEEYDLTNNSAVLSIGNADITVENVAVNEEETAVSADVSNVGYDGASDVKVQLREGSVTGMVIGEKTLNLSVGDKQSVTFTIDKSDMSFFDGAKQLYVTANGNFDEVELGNNDGYVYIASPSGSPDYQTEILNYSEIDNQYVINSVASNNTGEDIKCILYSAVYSENGILKGCGTVDADIEANNDTGVDIAVHCTIETGDTIKTFMWTENMGALANISELIVAE